MTGRYAVVLAAAKRTAMLFMQSMSAGTFPKLLSLPHKSCWCFLCRKQGGRPAPETEPPGSISKKSGETQVPPPLKKPAGFFVRHIYYTTGCAKEQICSSALPGAALSRKPSARFLCHNIKYKKALLYMLLCKEGNGRADHDNFPCLTLLHGRDIF